MDYKNHNKGSNKNCLIEKKIKKEDYSSFLSKTSRNFHLNIKKIKIYNSPIKGVRNKNVINEKFGFSVGKDNLTKSKQIKLPKYEKYKKYLFQLYRPDIKFSDFLEREETKKGKIKRTFSQI